AFERTIVSAGSRYDRYRRGRARLGAAERRGLALFMGERAGCRRCHGGPTFGGNFTHAGPRRARPLFHNIGLYDLDGAGADPGHDRGTLEVTARRADMGRFRAPSLRNVGRTAPYMHDGSVPTLAAAVRAHVRGGGARPLRDRGL